MNNWWKITVIEPDGSQIIFRHLTFDQAMEICRRNEWTWIRPFDMQLEEDNP